MKSGTLSTCPSDSGGTESCMQPLLQCLGAPQPSDLARERGIRKNPPVTTKCGKGRCSDTPKNFTAGDHVLESISLLVTTDYFAQYVRKL